MKMSENSSSMNTEEIVYELYFKSNITPEEETAKVCKLLNALHSKRE